MGVNICSPIGSDVVGGTMARLIERIEKAFRVSVRNALGAAPQMRSSRGRRRVEDASDQFEDLRCALD